MIVAGLLIMILLFSFHTLFVDRSLFEKSVNENSGETLSFEIKPVQNSNMSGLNESKIFNEKDTFLNYILEVCKDKLYEKTVLPINQSNLILI